LKLGSKVLIDSFSKSLQIPKGYQKT